MEGRQRQCSGRVGSSGVECHVLGRGLEVSSSGAFGRAQSRASGAWPIIIQRVLLAVAVLPCLPLLKDGVAGLVGGKRKMWKEADGRDGKESRSSDDVTSCSTKTKRETQGGSWGGTTCRFSAGLSR